MLVCLGISDNHLWYFDCISMKINKSAILTVIGLAIFLVIFNYVPAIKPSVVAGQKINEKKGGEGVNASLNIPLAPPQSPPKSHDIRVADGGDVKPLDNSQEEAKYRRWSSIAKSSYLNLLGAEDLSLNEAVIALLELDDIHAEILRKEVNDFVSAVKSEELKNAYVNSNESGDEEIVIKSFDPGKLMSDFQKRLEQPFDPTTAKFVGDLAGYDGMLKSIGSEVRLAYETGMNGENRIRVDSEIRSRQAEPNEDAFVKDGIIFSSKIKVNSSRILGRGNDSRYEALFKNVSSLPKSSNGSSASLNYDN